MLQTTVSDEPTFAPPAGRFVRYLLDTNILRKLFDKDETVLSYYRRTPKSAIGISVVTACEVVKGWCDEIARTGNADENNIKGKYDAFFIQHNVIFGHTVIPFTSSVVEVCSRLDRNMGARDRRIAATALAYGYKVVTINLKHFEKAMPAEDIVDWSLNPDWERNT